MKLIQLKLFKDIAYSKSFVKAAQINFMTQPSVSIHLKQLEEELEVKLFDRVPKKVVLTQEGLNYLPHVEDILNRCENLLALKSSNKKNIKGLIRIASIYSIGMYELGPFLKNFIKEYPGIQIHLEYQDACQIYELVQKRKINLGMVAYPKDQLKIKTKTFALDQLCLIVYKEHPLAMRKKIKIKEIQNENFIAFDLNTPTRIHVDNFLKDKKISINVKMVNNNIFALKRAVEAGIGISIIPSGTVEEECKRGDLIKIKIEEMNIYRPLGILTPKKGLTNRIEQIFIGSLIQYFGI